MNDIDKNFLDIKNTTLELENSIKEQELKLTSTINNDEDKLKDLSDKKILFDKNKIQADILKNQQFLIDEYKRNINRLNLELTETQKTNQELSISNDKIKFYQDDNIRLSSQVNDFQKKYETIKNNFNEVEKEKNVIFNKIKELNNSLLKNNIIGTPFLEKKIEEDTINSKVLNDISENNLNDNKNSDKDIDLDVTVNDIFK
jgi:hypothetical protein|tara:strand:+ start:1660 stop:2265 length:606 start_codon:yes stop_codon:yes gene_type:complete